MAHKWKDIKHKFSDERREEIRQEALAELDRIGFGKLRQAREQTQVALAERLDVPQSAISRMERRTDLLLSTLRTYIEGLGGTLELRAVFPDGEFLLDSLRPPNEPKPRRAAKSKKQIAA
jgi:transcriptional regulator with XRE-family HTH domain